MDAKYGFQPFSGGNGIYRMKTVHTPRVIIFQCRFNLYGQDAECRRIFSRNSSRNSNQVRVVHVPCTGRIDPFFLLNAVQEGVDGIMIAGCVPEKCHFRIGNLAARRHLDAFGGFLTYLGMESDRIRFVWLEPTERGRLTSIVTEFIRVLRRLGPAHRLVTRTKVSGVRCQVSGGAGSKAEGYSKA